LIGVIMVFIVWQLFSFFLQARKDKAAGKLPPVIAEA
jgi:hypothetical protein